MDEGSHGTTYEKMLVSIIEVLLGSIFSSVFSQRTPFQVNYVSDGAETQIKAKTSLLKSQRFILTEIRYSL